MAYFLRRLGFYLVALWVAVTMNFLLPRMMPGDPIDAIIARSQGRLPPAAVNALRAQLGLSHDPLWQQYFTYLGNLVHGNLGISFDYYPATVTSMLGDSIFWTINLLGVALLISAGLGTLRGDRPRSQGNGTFSRAITQQYAGQRDLPARSKGRHRSSATPSGTSRGSGVASGSLFAGVQSSPPSRSSLFGDQECAAGLDRL